MASAEANVQPALGQASIAARSSRLSLRHKEALAGYIFILPAVLGFILWTAGPMLYSLWLSFHSWNLVQPPKWIGLGNYREMWNDRIFWASVRATLTYAAILVPLFQLLSFSMALLLNTKLPGIRLFPGRVLSAGRGAQSPRLVSLGIHLQFGIRSAQLLSSASSDSTRFSGFRSPDTPWRRW